MRRRGYDLTMTGLSQNSISWPRKSREFENHHFNSRAWNDFSFRPDDIFVATYAKTGTTWMQQIVLQLLFEGREDASVANVSPWIDFRALSPEMLQRVAALEHRRVLKTHLPLDALVYSQQAKYIYICRDGRDVAWSLFNHYSHLTDDFYKLVNDTPGRVGPPLPKCDVEVIPFFKRWLAEDGYPYWPFFSHIASWWEYRHLPNLMLVHFAELKRDLEGAIRRLSEFLEVPVQPSAMPRVLEHCSFEYMRENADRMAPRGGVAWEGGGKTFINKGTNGRWREMLSQSDIDEYESRASEKLGIDCAKWLADGGWL
jgi:aryl sulfotransferase